MRNSIYYSTLLICLILLITACDGTSVLDISPRDQLSEDAVLQDPQLIEQFINNVYLGIGHGFYATSISSGVDETKHTHGWGDETVRQSNFTPDDLGIFTFDAFFRQYTWDEIYGNVRNANIVLESIEGVAMPEERRNRLKGEALFLRAKLYHNLVKMWGGVPIITRQLGLDDDLLIPRSSFEETINFIREDLNEAADLLPVSNMKGRATKGAALALKSRVLLIAASDLYHVNPSGMAETGYIGGDQQSLWRAAKNTAEEVMNLGEYELYQANPSPSDSTAENYADIFLTDNNEKIFVRPFSSDAQFAWFEADIGLFNGPNGYANWGGDTPLQQHVDAYEMSDGSEFDWSNPEHAANPYENRDPRFYASILYNGAKWAERPEELIDVDSEGIVQTAKFEVEGQSDLRPGLDTREGPIQDWNGTWTGYYMRKFLDINVDHQFEMQEHPWVFIRFAEVLLNYAEASYELGEVGDALNAINQIRRRAGMPEVSDSGVALRDRIRNERRIELAFEYQRYFDVRRWMIAPDVYENGRAVNISGRLNPDGGGSYIFEYEVFDIDQRQWQDRAYFLPIPRDEMEANTNLIQNPGYN